MKRSSINKTYLRIALLPIVAVMVSVMTACGSGTATTSSANPAPSVSVATEAPSVSAQEPTTAPNDPYEVYLANNPDKSLVLSREDAQARAYLGCTMKFAPGTIDYVLQQAYADLCKSIAK